ncbi:hypothetical protein L9F63_018887 [Diploptera punctata]|uniref:G domain-containing protein n=1 Tax=Diploptera punctata TaxID=6984 RepID=A0AAD7ZWI1_DIPPU|nr:hypothetical protein L9F63_018887 [Diploptera punctata]
MMNRLSHSIFSVINPYFEGLSYCCVRNNTFSGYLRRIEVRHFSNLSESSSYSEDLTLRNKEFSNFNKENENKCEFRLLKVAIIGVPNSGKSTVINQLVGRRVCSISSKVHTTRCKARAIAIHGNTQLVFLDTPGLVTSCESQRHHLEHKFHTDSEMAMLEADVIGVVHDVANHWTRHRLDPKVLRLLYLYPRKRSFLMLNKIDTMKSKRKLLDIIRTLTNNSLGNYTSSSVQEESQILCHDYSQKKSTNKMENDDKTNEEFYQFSELQLRKKLDKEKGWPYFKEVFMISALNGEGTFDVRDYLCHISKPAPWLFPPTQFTDQPSETVILDTVRSKLLDDLPQEMPYNIKVAMEYYGYGAEGMISIVVLVGCPSARIQRLLVGSRGLRIRSITKAAVEDLEKTFLQPVRLRLVVTSVDKTSPNLPPDYAD